jgi:hypothetical protein
VSADALAVVLGAFPGAVVMPHDYGRPDDPINRLMAARRRVALRDGVWHLDGAPVSAEALAAAAGLPAPPPGAAPPSPTPSKRNRAAEPAAERQPATRGGPLPASLPPGIDPAAVVVLGRRVFADGRQVATLTPPTEERSR